MNIDKFKSHFPHLCADKSDDEIQMIIDKWRSPDYQAETMATKLVEFMKDYVRNQQ